MDDPVEMVDWLRGVVTGDLERAKSIPEDFRRWRVNIEGDVVPAETGPAYIAVGPWSCGIEDAYAEHIAIHDPNDTIARCEQELEIIDEVLWDGEQETVQWVRKGVPWPCRTIGRLAYGYRNREGWKESWKT